MTEHVLLITTTSEKSINNLFFYRGCRLVGFLFFEYIVLCLHLRYASLESLVVMDSSRSKKFPMCPPTFGGNWQYQRNASSSSSVSLWNQNMAIAMYNNDMLPPSMVHWLPAAMQEGRSIVKNEKDYFKVMFNVTQFKPEQVEVQIINNCVEIYCKHEEKTDEHGFIQREFTRRYVLPEGTEAGLVKSSLSPNGILTIEVPKKATEPPTDVRAVPIAIEQE